MNYLKEMSNIQKVNSIKDILESKIRTIITIDLTIGRKDDFLKPFTQDKIDHFIQENNDKIEFVIKNMIDDYFSMFDGFDSMQNPPSLAWIREYLYEHVDTQIEQRVNEMEQMD